MEGEGEGEARLWCCSALHSLSRSPQLKSKLLGCGVLQRGLLPILLKAADELGDWAEVKIRHTLTVKPKTFKWQTSSGTGPR
jgi:hypothetical protein